MMIRRASDQFKKVERIVERLEIADNYKK